MTWKPPPDFDRRIREWMDTHGWPVTTQESELQMLVVWWRHEGPDGDYTLYVTRSVIADYSTPSDRIDEFIEELDRHDVAAQIKEDPGAYTVVIMSEGRIAVDQLKEWPT